ncbi:GNAT family N-acetyltransferase [Pseudooceanicola sp. LIPI14-2-Ac024]|uniref:GNAT family N-acetyltransferase n=1 Tax=Pseudooceanicola sp. LIPI14-2-Ac024 TaxID=3344875 RepID=UPI0035CFC461
MSLDIPVIKTDRLILRDPRETDFPVVAEFAASERTEFIGGPQDRFSAWQGLLGQLGHWALRGYGLWMIEDRETGKAVGRTGVIRHDGWPEPELGWTIFSGQEGHGFAKEAAEAARLYAAREWGFERLISQIHPDNGRSISLALRLGAVQEEETTLFGEPCLIFRHPDPREAEDAA